MFKEIIKFLKKNWPIVSILALSTFLRFWNLPGLLHWTFDEDVYAFHLKQIIVDHHVPLIGVSAAPLGMELGPLFYWIMSVPFWVGRLNPISLGILASSLGVLTTVFVYKLVKISFGDRVGIFSALIYASSFLIVMLDKHFWSVTPQIFIAFFVIFSLVKIIEGHNKWMLSLAAILGFAIQSDLLSLVYFPLTLISFWYFKVSLKNRDVAYAILIFLALQFPLLLFELRHDFYNTHALLRFINNGPSSGGFAVSSFFGALLDIPRFLSRLIYIAGPHDIARESTYCFPEIAARNARIPVGIFLAAVLLLGFFLKLAKDAWLRKGKPILKLVFLQLLITSFSIMVYGAIFKKNVFEFYLISLIPGFIITFSLFIEFLWKRVRVLAMIVLATFVLVNGWAVLGATHSFGYQYKIEMLNWSLSQIRDKPFAIYSLGSCHKFEGHRYPLYFLGHEPVQSYTDPELAWLYGKESGAKNPEISVVFVSLTQDDTMAVKEGYSFFAKDIVSSKQFGGTEVLIVQNARDQK